MSEAATTVKEEQLKPEEIAIKWWRELQDRRGDRAELRRARSLEAVIFTAGYQRLWQRLRGAGWSREDGVALVAAVLAHAKEDDASACFAAQLAASGHGDKPRYSGLRFRRLLQNESWEELFEPAIRAVALIGGRANLADLAKGLYYWNHLNHRTRREWAFDYYGANPNAE
jgi:CRISPR system Cascade subunit CasB